MELSIVNDNILLVDDPYLDLRYPTNQGQLAEALKSKPMFIDSIESMYERYTRLNPDAQIKKGFIWLGVLTLQRAFKVKASKEAYFQFYESQYNRGVITKKEHLITIYHKLWDLVLNSGFTPEVRMSSRTPYPCGPKRRVIHNAVDLFLRESDD